MAVNYHYIVQYQTHKGAEISVTLSEWCRRKEKSYNTIMARIIRSNIKPKGRSHVIYLSPKDKVLSLKNFKEGVPVTGQKSPNKKLKGNDCGTKESINSRRSKSTKRVKKR